MNQTDELKQAGLKTTTPRLKVLQILESNSSIHLSAEEILHALNENKKNIGLATIYRVLAKFEAAGLVLRHHFADRWVFELADKDHHDHMLCIDCGKFIEFHDDMIEQQQLHIANKHGFEIQNHSLCLYGKCSNCL